MEKVSAAFRVYGDNILECEHFIEWLNNEKLSRFKFIKEVGPLDRPIFIYKDLELKDTFYAFQLCPYFGGTGSEILWENNPLEDIFSEKIDVIITKVNENYTETKPILAIEFCDALQAGNQSWQRFRRAINAAEARIPYLYIIPIIGWERDSAGLKLKNPRYQNAQVCIAHLTLSSRFGVPSIMVFTKTSWTEFAKEKGYTVPAEYELFEGYSQGIKLSCYLIRESFKKERKVKENVIVLLKELFKDMIIVSRTYSKFGNTYLPIHYNHIALKPENLEKVTLVYAKAIESGQQVEGEYALHNINFKYFSKFGVPFYKDAQSKTCNLSFKKDVLSFFNWKKSVDKEYKIQYLRAWGVKVNEKLSSKQIDQVFEKNKEKLPLTYKEGKSEAFVVNNRRHLREILSKAYPSLSAEFLDAIHSEKSIKTPMFVIPLYAYKPSGDSRPDRGLLPVLVSLFPNIAKKENILVLIYSKYTPKNWKRLMKSGNNELWNVINKLAGFVLVDNTKDGLVLFEEAKNND